MQLPVEFCELAEASIGKEAFALFYAHFDENAGSGVTSIRINPFKNITDSNVVANFENDTDATVGVTQVPWCSNGYYLSKRPTFTLDPLFHCGAYYVQEASSMYMELAAAAIEQAWSNNQKPDNSLSDSEPSGNSSFFKKPLNVLDLCAAPGGKSTHLLSLLNSSSLLVANEVIKSRSIILADNIAKWGVDNVVVTNNDPQDFRAFENYFNLIVVDAPCSGEGLFIKDPQAIEEWSLDNVNLCAQRQQRILANIWPALKPGGFLIYSTCTYNKFENDGNLEFLKQELGAEIIYIPIPNGCNIHRTANGGLQFVPGMIEGEGQFIAVVRKRECVSETPYSNKDKRNSFKGREGKKQQNAAPVEKDCNYLSGEKYILTLNGDFVKGYRKDIYQQIKFVESNLRCVLSGIAVANKKGKDYIPHSDLALQKVFMQMAADGCLPSKIALVEVGREDALKFLAKEPLTLKDAPLGYILLAYKGFGLGFLKNIGNRTNNLLPMARRIRMEIKY